MNIGDIRKIIADLPDEMPFVLIDSTTDDTQDMNYNPDAKDFSVEDCYHSEDEGTENYGKPRGKMLALFFENKLNENPLVIEESSETDKIKSAYREMVKQYKDPVEPNRVNCYTCKRGHVTKTIDRDKGVTPYMIKCETCGEFAQSSMYKDTHPEIEPTQEWYRPSLFQVLILQKRGWIGPVDHVLKGGLDNRKIEKQPA